MTQQNKFSNYKLWLSASTIGGPSDQDNLPTPRFQMQNGSVDRYITTSSTGAAKKRYTGRNASASFGASY